MQKDELVQFLFDSRPHLLADSLREWMECSPRVAAFVDAHRDKIRKKIRVNQAGDSLRDLQVELETAFLLLNEPRFALAYEPYASSKTRGPDFSVTFRTRTVFNLEVTHMRAAVQDPSFPGQPSHIPFDDVVDPPEKDPFMSDHLAEIVCGKLGQLLPGMMNVLVIATEVVLMNDLELDKAMQRLKIMVERNNAWLLARNNFRGPADFFKIYLRMSALVLRETGTKPSRQTPILWKNKQARHPVPDKICDILRREL